ncbi:methyltransferase domain-containing protein [Streptomyces erythrochromogenes]|uniref:class I SAM-dependent methyltransferase n=1 Tax=Streptomyces TaxID=1883 RepID=UPI003417B7C9
MSAHSGTGAERRDRSLEHWNAAPYARALACGSAELSLRDGTGWILPLATIRWCGRADACDMGVVRRCEGTVLDIGCGPGRVVKALAERGHHALGIDISLPAVRAAVSRGGSALCRSIFDPLPDEGRWQTALLLDGNIGIGGDPSVLLRRIRALVREGGQLIVEVPLGGTDRRHLARLHEGHRPVQGSFPWATVGADALTRHAADTGWAAKERWTSRRGRHFVSLQTDR